jgi:hypothetical protein
VSPIYKVSRSLIHCSPRCSSSGKDLLDSSHTMFQQLQSLRRILICFQFSSELPLPKGSILASGLDFARALNPISRARNVEVIVFKLSCQIPVCSSQQLDVTAQIPKVYGWRTIDRTLSDTSSFPSLRSVTVLLQLLSVEAIPGSELTELVRRIAKTIRGSGLPRLVERGTQVQIQRCFPFISTCDDVNLFPNSRIEST